MWRPQHIWLVLATLASAPAAAEAQGRGFLFEDPRYTLSLYGGFARASAGSDVFDFSIDELTLERSDFSSFAFGADMGFRLAPQMDLVLGIARSASSTKSEFRDWVDSEDQPIEQVTRFRRVPLSASLRYHFTPRGRTIGAFAWVPSTFVPWVGLGAGMMSYKLEQVGDFVDFETFEVFPEHFTSEGWAPMLQGSLGGGWSLSPRLLLNGELRYVYATDALEGDFSGFDRVDLSGLSTSVGLALRF
ncbi:MAG TPA: hypothetical protein VFM71_00695 [Gemmatimonadaceae bacterium]|nr:hypothetical protein [Gemmatimonadaceae bacterium]